MEGEALNTADCILLLSLRGIMAGHGWLVYVTLKTKKEILQSDISLLFLKKLLQDTLLCYRLLLLQL